MTDGTEDVETGGIDEERRTFVAGIMGLLLSGCTCADLKPLPAALASDWILGDAHAHLFNAADLPVEGFLRHVLLPQYLDGWEILWPSIIGTAAMLKTMALSASSEMKRLAPIGSDGEERISVERFADAVANHLELRLRAAGPAALTTADSGPEGRSYAALALLVEDAAARQRGDTALLPPPSQGQPDIARIGTIDRAFIASVAREGSAAVTALPDADNVAQLSLGPQGLRTKMAGLWDGLKWIHALIQPRCSHMRDYLATMTAKDSRTIQIVNLLVDYDAWLGDGPSAGSDINAQLRFWTRYARHADDRVALELFAPYDPLRHAESRLATGDDSGYFATVRQWAMDGRSDIVIRGFKLYPPMGFRAAGNVDAPPDARSGVAIRGRWAGKGWPLTQFGAELERSLDSFFDFCSQQRIPLLAHAANSQESYEGAGLNASPRFWLDRARKQGERGITVCLAHFSHEDFGTDLSAEVLRHNATDSPSKIYFDLSFADEVLKGGGRALMKRIASLCEAHDRDCQWFLFGTDWIMLGHEHGVDRYVTALLEATEGTSFWTRPRLDNLLRRNLQTFLARPSPA